MCAYKISISGKAQFPKPLPLFKSPITARCTYPTCKYQDTSCVLCAQVRVDSSSPLESYLGDMPYGELFSLKSKEFVVAGVLNRMCQLLQVNFQPCSS